MTVSSRFEAHSWNSGVAYMTPATIPDGNVRFPANGHGQATGTATSSAVLSSQLCSILGLFLAGGSSVGAGRLFLDSHDGLVTYLGIPVPAALTSNVYHRFGRAGLLIPGAWRWRWVATIGGTTGPVFFTCFYQDHSEREEN